MITKAGKIRANYNYRLCNAEDCDNRRMRNTYNKSGLCCSCGTKARAKERRLKGIKIPYTKPTETIHTLIAEARKKWI